MKRLAIVSMLGLALLTSGCLFAEDTSVQQAQATESKEIHETHYSLDGVVLETMDGEKFDFSTLKGKPVYVKVWATWCPTCVKGMPKMEELMADKNRKYEVVTVVLPGVFNEKSPEEFRQWYSEQPYKNVPVLFDTQAKLVQRYNIHAMPTSLIVDKTLKVHRVMPGQLPTDVINKMYKTLDEQ